MAVIIRSQVEAIEGYPEYYNRSQTPENDSPDRSIAKSSEVDGLDREEGVLKDMFQ